MMIKRFNLNIMQWGRTFPLKPPQRRGVGLQGALVAPPRSVSYFINIDAFRETNISVKLFRYFVFEIRFMG